MLVLIAIDLWSLILYGVTNISLIDIEILVILLYISSYFITSELYIRPSNTNARNNDSVQNNNNNNNTNNNDNANNNNNNNNNDFNNNISKYYSKIRKSDIFCFHNFWGVIAAQGVMSPIGKKRCYKSTVDHK